MKKRKKFTSHVTGESYVYYADMVLHTDLALKEMAAEPRKLKPLTNETNILSERPGK